ncbi:Hypothetical protein FKW44_024216 [Caligus rogercresseyi]|uniref:Uncharacterized protein n=1 Tax=Caligus rogercresseyi TaxID=217165 RepID=A0A7T8GML0_CALRO|nr:Hypothetical protein FKW44_024216 [Caligus rogercresseyi]
MCGNIFSEQPSSTSSSSPPPTGSVAAPDWLPPATPIELTGQPDAGQGPREKGSPQVQDRLAN